MDRNERRFTQQPHLDQEKQTFLSCQLSQLFSISLLLNLRSRRMVRREERRREIARSAHVARLHFRTIEMELRRPSPPRIPDCPLAMAAGSCIGLLTLVLTRLLAAQIKGNPRLNSRSSHTARQVGRNPILEYFLKEKMATVSAAARLVSRTAWLGLSSWCKMDGPDMRCATCCVLLKAWPSSFFASRCVLLA